MEQKLVELEQQLRRDMEEGKADAAPSPEVSAIRTVAQRAEEAGRESLLLRCLACRTLMEQRIVDFRSMPLPAAPAPGAEPEKGTETVDAPEFEAAQDAAALDAAALDGAAQGTAGCPAEDPAAEDRKIEAAFLSNRSQAVEAELRDWIDQLVLSGDMEPAKEITRIVNRVRSARKELERMAGAGPEITAGENTAGKLTEIARREEKARSELETAKILRDALVKKDAPSVTDVFVVRRPTGKGLRAKADKLLYKYRRPAWGAAVAAAIVLAMVLHPAALVRIAEAPAPPDLSKTVELTEVRVVGNLVHAGVVGWDGLDDGRRDAVKSEICGNAGRLGFRGIVLFDGKGDAVMSCASAAGTIVQPKTKT